MPRHSLDCRVLAEHTRNVDDNYDNVKRGGCCCRLLILETADVISAGRSSWSLVRS